MISRTPFGNFRNQVNIFVWHMKLPFGLEVYCNTVLHTVYFNRTSKLFKHYFLFEDQTYIKIQNRTE